jgi:hypothetical protein
MKIIRYAFLAVAMLVAGSAWAQTAAQINLLKKQAMKGNIQSCAKLAAYYRANWMLDDAETYYTKQIILLNKKKQSNEAMAVARLREQVRKLRDNLCFLPGKLAAAIMLVDALFLKLNTRGGERILKSDSRKCTRVAFGSCRAVLAGVLGISLLPEEVFTAQFMRTFTIGEQISAPDAKDITLSNQLMLGTAFIIMLLLFAIKLTAGILLY